MTTKTKGKIDGPTRDYCNNPSKLCAAIRIGKAAGMAIISELGYRTSCVRWVPKMLTVKRKKPGKIPVQNFASSAGTAEMLFC
jgi:hypothetical protein